jgi:hypothetical protein
LTRRCCRQIQFPGDIHNKSAHFYKIRIESPVSFDRAAAPGGLEAPRSLLRDSRDGAVRFRLQNRMTHTRLLKRPDGDSTACYYVIRAAAAAAAPRLESRTPGAAAAAPVESAETGGWLQRSYQGAVPEMEAKGVAALEYGIELDPAAEPGQTFQARAEHVPWLCSGVASRKICTCHPIPL